MRRTVGVSECDRLKDCLRGCHLRISQDVPLGDTPELEAGRLN